MNQSIIVGEKDYKTLHNFKVIIVRIFRLNSLTIEFALHAVQIKNQKPFSLPDCYHFSIKVFQYLKENVKRLIFLLFILVDI